MLVYNIFQRQNDRFVNFQQKFMLNEGRILIK